MIGSEDLDAVLQAPICPVRKLVEVAGQKSAQGIAEKYA